MFRPFRADLLWHLLPRAALHGFAVALCPGLICFGPFGAKIRINRMNLFSIKLAIPNPFVSRSLAPAIPQSVSLLLAGQIPRRGGIDRVGQIHKSDATVCEQEVHGV